MMDENSKKCKRWVLVVAGVNVAYSIVFMAVAFTEILSYTNNVLAWILIGVYVINISLNITLLEPFLNWKPLAVAWWFIYTTIVLVFRICLTDYLKWSNGLKMLSIFVNVYILVSTVIMVIVCLKLANIMKGLDSERVFRSKINCSSVGEKTDGTRNFVSPQKSFVTSNDCKPSNIYEISDSEMNGYDNISTLNCNIEYLPSAPDFEFEALDDIQLSNTDRKFCDNTCCHDDNDIGKNEGNCRADKTEAGDKKRDDSGGHRNHSTWK